MSTMASRNARHLAPEALDTILRAAVLAPSSHNTQPWTFVLEPGVVHLRADRTRALPVNDPEDRELTISCGAALFNLRVAAVHAGAAPAIALLPDARDPDLLATVHLHGGGLPPADVARLNAAIARRRTHRDGFADVPLPPSLGDERRAIGHADGAWLELVDVDTREGLADLVAEADRMQWADRHWRRELAAWMHPRRSCDGLAMPDLVAPLARATIATLDVGMPTAARDRDHALEAPAVVVLDTHGDRPRDWLITGMALEHALLHAASQGVQASYLNQPIQVAELRMRVASLLERPCFPQVIMQIGHPAHPSGPARRRPLADVIESAPQVP
jgi:nitroreductase